MTEGSTPRFDDGLLIKTYAQYRALKAARPATNDEADANTESITALLDLMAVCRARTIDGLAVKVRVVLDEYWPLMRWNPATYQMDNPGRAHMLAVLHEADHFLRPYLEREGDR